MCVPVGREIGARFGTMFEVSLTRRADQFFASADKSLAKKLARCFDRLSAEPFSGNNVKALKGELFGCWRYRVGDWRVIYEVNQVTMVVNVITIAHRKDAYE